MFPAKTTVFLNSRFLEFRFFLSLLRHKNLAPTVLEPEFRVCFYSFLSFGCICNAMVMRNRIDMTELIAKYEDSVLSVLKVSMHMISPKTYRRSHLHESMFVIHHC